MSQALGKVNLQESNRQTKEDGMMRETGIPAMTQRLRWLAGLMLMAGLTACGGGGGDSVPVPSPVPPSIATQPASQSVQAGQSATFSVAAAGDAPLTYQWLRGGADVPGATSTTYVLMNPQIIDSGSILTARVTNPAGSVMSASATLTVTSVPMVGTLTLLAGDLEQTGASDGAGNAARFNVPRGIAVDASGNVLVADSFNHSIRKIQADGLVSTLAGLSGAPGSADGSSAAARFLRPIGVAMDADGILYVMDAWELTPFSLMWQSIRTVSAQGEVRTAYSIPPYGADRPGLVPPGLAVGTNGDVYAAGAQGGLWRFGRTSPPVLLGTGSGVWQSAVARDSAGNLYFTNGNSIQKRTADGTVTIFAGSPTEAGSADGVGPNARFGFQIPPGSSTDPTAYLAFDASGNLFVSDARNHTIRKVTANGVVTTVAGKPGVAGTVFGPLSDALLKSPQGIAVVNEKLLYVASGQAVLKVMLP